MPWDMRSVWAALATIVLGLNAVGLPYSYAKYKSVCTTTACAHPEGTPASHPKA